MAYGREGAKVVTTPGGVLPGGLIFEQVDNEGQVQFAVRYPQSDEIRVQPYLKIGEYVIYQPLSPSPWVLPPPPIDYVSLENLWLRLRNFAYDHIDFEYDVQYDVFVAWIIASWTPERWDSVPYLWFTGPPKSGKTRCLDVLNYLAYRPLMSPSVSAASIYRALDSYHPTFLLDEFEMYQKIRELKAEVIGVLNAGYRRGQVVLRTDKVKDGAPVLRGFSCFGFKAITSIVELPPALKTRTIPFIMSKAVRKVKRMIDKEEARELRGMLLKYRFDHCTLPPPAGNPIDLPDGRLIELYTPLVCVAPESKEKVLLEYATGQYREEVMEEYDTDEAKVFLAILDMLMEQPRPRIPQADIREKVNARLPEKEQFSAQKLGLVLKRLGFKSVLNKERLKEVVMDSKVIERRAVRYVVPEEMEKVSEVLRKLAQVHKLTLVDTSTGGQACNIAETNETCATYATYAEALAAIKSWLHANKDEKSQVSLTALSNFIKEELKRDPQKVISKLFEEGIIVKSPEPGKAVVV